jgi:hypothetical protein
MVQPMDEPDEKAGMTVKAMPTRARQRALKAAAKQGQSMAEWLTRAIDQLADREEGARETFPDEMGNRGNLPAVPTPPAVVMIPPGFLAEITEAMRAAQAVSAAGGVPVPKVVARHAFTILADHLRTVRGMPPVKPRRRGGETKRETGETKAKNGETALPEPVE